MDYQTHIIVTRPSGKADSLLGNLNDIFDSHKEIKISHLPLIEVCELEEEKYSGASDVANCKYDGVIFISGNAVDFCERRLTTNQFKRLLTNRLYTVGKQTADNLAVYLINLDHQATIKFPAQMNSEGLLAMNEMMDVEGKSLLIVKGLGGRNELYSGLTKRGARVVVFDVYERKFPKLVTEKKIQSMNQSQNIWLITSIQALENLSRILNHQCKNCRIIVSSDRIAREAKSINFVILAQSKGATDEQLANCIKGLSKKIVQV